MADTTPLRTDRLPAPRTRRTWVRWRRPHARFSLRWRLTLLFGIAFAIILGALFLTLHNTLLNTLLSDADDELSTHAARIAGEAGDNEVFGDPDRLRALVHSGSVGGLISSPSLVAVRDLRGRVIAQSSDIRLDELAPTRSEIARLRAGETTFRTIRTDGGRVRVVTTPIQIDGRVVGIVQAGESLEGRFAAGDRLQVLLIIEGSVGLVVAAAIGFAFVWRSLKPLEKVGAIAEDIEANDLTRRINLRRQPVEVQTLADTFDAMLERLESSFEQQRSFVLDVSHELRTPLTALRGNLDVLLMDPNLPADVRAQLERMSAETGRLIRLAANLLYLAQADTGKQGMIAPVELDLLCLEVVQQATSLRPGVRLRLGHEDQVTVIGDRDLLKQLLLNLVENGLTYTPAGGRVTLSLAREEGWAAIEVRDTGVGIAPEDLPHIFERFYRAESTRRRAAGGSGVGLSIVEWVTKLHGGNVTVESRPGKGSVFTVRLPLPPAVPVAPDAEPSAQAAEPVAQPAGAHT